MLKPRLIYKIKAQKVKMMFAGVFEISRESCIFEEL